MKFTLFLSDLWVPAVYFPFGIHRIFTFQHFNNVLIKNKQKTIKTNTLCFLFHFSCFGWKGRSGDRVCYNARNWNPGGLLQMRTMRISLSTSKSQQVSSADTWTEPQVAWPLTQLSPWWTVRGIWLKARDSQVKVSGRLLYSLGKWKLISGKFACFVK